MSGRGRGRGGGRGRFGGSSSFIPQARGDDGVAVIRKIEIPPVLFPALTKLPDLPDVVKTDEELFARRRRLETFWNASPYYIELPKEKTSGIAEEIERYSDKYKPNFKAKRPPLSSVLKLTSAYFPAELIGAQDRRRVKYKGTSQWTLDASSRKSDLQRLDRLATLEQRSEKMAEEGKDEEKKTEEGEDEEDEIEEEEEEEIGEDDYAQNFGFDDDDEYLEDDDGGEDEGPTY